MLAIVKRPWPTLTLTLAFVMIGQNRQGFVPAVEGRSRLRAGGDGAKDGNPHRSGIATCRCRHLFFPSGHAASAFAFAYAVARDQPRLAVPIWLLAGAVAHSRVLTGVHYPSDVVLGFVFGAGTAARVSARE